MSNALAVAANKVVAVAGKPALSSYLDEISPSTIAGTMIKFDGKAGKYIITETKTELKMEGELVAMCDHTLAGWIKFNGAGNPPDKVMVALYEGEGNRPCPRTDLPDQDESKWPLGLNNLPADPWQHQIYLVLQRREGDGELYTFVASSQGARKAVGSLLRHYEKMRRDHPGEYPVIRLSTGSYPHKDPRVGKVNTPVFTVVGRAPRDSVAQPSAAISDDMDDMIPF